jgi:hypothetical protein
MNKSYASPAEHIAKDSEDLYKNLAREIVNRRNSEIEEIRSNPAKYNAIHGCNGANWLIGLNQKVIDGWVEKFPELGVA